MSNGGQQPPTGGAETNRSGGSWVALAAIGSVCGVVISQYFPIFGGNGDAPWSAGRLVLIPLHVVLFGGVAALVGWSMQRKSSESTPAAAAAHRASNPPSPPASSRTPAPASPTIPKAPAPELSSADLEDDAPAPGDKHEAITAPPPKMTESADGAPTAQRMEIAAQVAQEEEDDRTLVGDLSELAKAQELAELQRQHREKKKAEQAAAGPASSKKGQP